MTCLIYLTHLTQSCSKAVCDRRISQVNPQGHRPCGSMRCVRSLINTEGEIWLPSPRGAFISGVPNFGDTLRHVTLSPSPVMLSEAKNLPFAQGKLRKGSHRDSHLHDLLSKSRAAHTCPGGQCRGVSLSLRLTCLKLFSAQCCQLTLICQL